MTSTTESVNFNKRRGIFNDIKDYLYEYKYTFLIAGFIIVIVVIVFCDFCRKRRNKARTAAPTAAGEAMPMLTSKRHPSPQIRSTFPQTYPCQVSNNWDTLPVGAVFDNLSPTGNNVITVETPGADKCDGTATCNVEV